MSFLHTVALDHVNAAEIQRTKAFDTVRVQAGSFQFTLEGATGPSVALALEGSNAVPPNGVSPGNSWEPPATSWLPLGGTGSLLANGTERLAAPATALLTRWVRATATPTAGSGGQLTVEVFLRDSGS